MCLKLSNYQKLTFYFNISGYRIPFFESVWNRKILLGQYLRCLRRRFHRIQDFRLLFRCLSLIELLEHNLRICSRLDRFRLPVEISFRQVLLEISTISKEKQKTNFPDLYYIRFSNESLTFLSMFFTRFQKPKNTLKEAYLT